MTQVTAGTTKQAPAGLPLMRQPVYASDFERHIYPFSPSERKLLQRAYRISSGCRRLEDGRRYFEHCKILAVLLIHLGVRDVHVIVAALLHNILKDHILALEDIEDIFGPLASGTVQILTKLVEEDLTTEQYFVRILGAEWQYCWRSWLVTCADRLYNLSTMVDGTSETAERFRLKKVRQVAETRQYVIPISVALSDLPQFEDIGKFFGDALTEWCDFRESETLSV